jgi:DNA-binding NarL/FixJ family response regulator
MMRDAAERMRYRDDAMQLSAGAENDEGEEMSPEENLEDARATEDTESAELRCDCERMLESDDVGVAGMLMEGQTHEEIARALGLTQQAVAKRVRRMRSVLEGLRAG